MSDKIYENKMKRLVRVEAGQPISANQINSAFETSDANFKELQQQIVELEKRLDKLDKK